MFMWMPFHFGTLVAMQVYQTALWLACTRWWCACAPQTALFEERGSDSGKAATLQS